jgi:hypothetical protein
MKCRGLPAAALLGIGLTASVTARATRTLSRNFAGALFWYEVIVD